MLFRFCLKVRKLVRNGKGIRWFFCVKAGKDEKVTNWNRFFDDNEKTMTIDERNDDEGQKYEEEDKKKEETKKNLSI